MLASPSTRTRPAPRALTARTTATSLFTFYDIESLSNVFSYAAYTPMPAGPDRIEMFYLLDNAAINDQVDYRILTKVIRAENPGLPKFDAWFYDLHNPDAIRRLATLMGVSDAPQVCDPSSPSSYPSEFRPVCDTDADYDPMLHPFMVGYNSLNYDTVQVAKYFESVLSEIPQHRVQLRKAQQDFTNAQHTQHPARKLETKLALDDQLNAKPSFGAVTAAEMRKHNDVLFSEEHIKFMPGALGWRSQAGKIRTAMLHSGRHIDAARLNELQGKTALKRLLGLLGYQIKESEKLKHDSVITSVEQLYDLLAYNVSDCLGLSQLFAHPTYSSAFDLKAALLAQYTETVFDKFGNVRRDRISIDASSAKFVGRILAPFESLKDIQTVSFLYPEAEIAKERGIPQVNVLDECVAFFEKDVTPDRATNPYQAKAHADFMQVVAYYRSIEGKNFNDSEGYAEMFGDDSGDAIHLLDDAEFAAHLGAQNQRVHSLDRIPKSPNNLPYFNADGTPSACFATFSTGGIHGAEADVSALQDVKRAQQKLDEQLQLAKRLFPEATQFVAAAKDQHNQLMLPTGVTVDKRLVLIGSDPAKVRYRGPKKSDELQNAQLAMAKELVPDPAELLATQRPEEEALFVRIPNSFNPSGSTTFRGKELLKVTTAAGATYKETIATTAPELFIPKGDGSTKLHPKYTYTSAAQVTHEDFTSYYPNLLRNMRAFYNPELGVDRYATIFFQKEELGRQMKQPGLTDDEFARLKTAREGTKLILNAASGAGDASHDTPIRMNNQIISMRIIGQLFSWRIGQAQTLAGARIISTNTDGLYSVLDQEINDRVLAEQAALIGVDIEPEPMFLISKDSNNRLELDAPADGASLTESAIISASGGTLACHKGPLPTKSLSHPAVVDFALARYLRAVASRGEAALSEPFDAGLGRRFIEEALDLENPVQTALLFQNVITANRSSITYPFAAEPLASGAFATVEVDRRPPGDPLGLPPTEEAVFDETLTILRNPRPLQIVNRVFVVQAGSEEAVSLHAAGAWKIPAATLEKRKTNGNISVPDPIASMILSHHGWAATLLTKQRNPSLTLVPADQDIVVRKLPHVDPNWSMVVCNDDLRATDPDRLRAILTTLDIESYTNMLGETFTNTWKNRDLI